MATSTATATARGDTSKLSPFRHLLPPKDWYKIEAVSTSSARRWYEDRKDVPALKDFLASLKLENISRPYRGFTVDGTIIDGLFRYADDEGAPVHAMVASASRIITAMSPAQKEATLFDSVEADEIRIWSNPEFYVNPGGLRLDECSENIQSAVHDLLRSSLSPSGYSKLLGCCQINDFLGDLIDGKSVFNLHSYNFRLFGLPDHVKPWMFTFFGHHLCIAVFVQGKRMVIGPSFMGAEPDYIDEGPFAGLRLFDLEETVSLKLMQSLSPGLRGRAVLWNSMLPSELPKGRWVPHDERHVGGATQDNRIVPYEGCPVSLFSTQQKGWVVQLFRAFNEYYPAQVLEHRVATFVAHLDETYFAWIGGFEADDVYYFRIHSPVAFMEFDFHSGVYLTNQDPDKCHIHTVNRIPNRGDYGKALLEQFRREVSSQHLES